MPGTDLASGVFCAHGMFCVIGPPRVFDISCETSVQGVLAVVVEDTTWCLPAVPCTMELRDSCICDVGLLYFLTALLRWPVTLQISCSSTPAWNSRVAAVARSEWFVLYPDNPPASHMTATIEDSVCRPITWYPYHWSSLGLGSGRKYNASGRSFLGHRDIYFS